MRLLLVDDDERILVLLQRYLSQYGEIQTAMSGEEAIRVFKSTHENKQCFDVVFMDINMPGIGGHEVVNELRILEKKFGFAESATFKLVMISAYTETINLCKTLSYSNADIYITKPFTKKSLLSELKKHNILPE